MVHIDLICVGKLKEQYFAAAAAEYQKRLGAYCRLTITELPEARLSARPSEAETVAALADEAARMRIPSGAALWALCIEGERISSEGFARRLEVAQNQGVSRFVFLIGGSHGLSEGIKLRADVRLSMSEMTFPHHLARVMLLEQLYRAFQISGGGKYHK